MKKFLIILCLLLLSTTAHAQRAVVVEGVMTCPNNWGWKWLSNLADINFQGLGYEVLRSYGEIPDIEYDALYIIAHGNSWNVYPGCGTGIKYTELPRTKFSYFAMCDGLCGPGFRDTADESIGFCGMNTASCSQCWNVSTDFQTELMVNMRDYPVEVSYDMAMQEYPECSECIKYHKSVPWYFVPNPPDDEGGNYEEPETVIPPIVAPIIL